jgi:hypothetical protein
MAADVDPRARLCVSVVSKDGPATAPWPMAMSRVLSASAPPTANELSPPACVNEPSAVLPRPKESAPVPTARLFAWAATAL